MSSYRIDRGAALGHLAAAETLLLEVGKVPGLIATLPADASQEVADSVSGQLDQLGAHALVVGGGIEMDVSGPMLAAIAHALCAQVCLTEGQPRPESVDSPQAEARADRELREQAADCDCLPPYADCPHPPPGPVPPA